MGEQLIHFFQKWLGDVRYCLELPGPFSARKGDRWDLGGIDLLHFLVFTRCNHINFFFNLLVSTELRGPKYFPFWFGNKR